MEAIARRLKEVKLVLLEEPIGLMTVMELPSAFATQRKILDSSKQRTHHGSRQEGTPPRSPEA
jgi:hypothetical protein